MTNKDLNSKLQAESELVKFRLLSGSPSVPEAMNSFWRLAVGHGFYWLREKY